MRLALAPSWLAAAARSFLLLVAMALVAAVMLGAKGAPRPSREVRRDEIARFAPRPVLGIVQLGEEMLLVALLTWACRGPLKIRLESSDG